jgi:hypothetical protein
MNPAARQLTKSKMQAKGKDYKERILKDVSELA